MKPPDYTGKYFTVVELTRAIGITRQAYYKACVRAAHAKEREHQALQCVKQVRAKHVRMGTRKLYQENRDTFRALKIGRDTLFDLLREEDLLVTRRRQVRTTDSRHGWLTYDNLLIDRETGDRYRPGRPNEVFVSDITYIETLEGFRYLALVTDACSRKIVGYDLSGSLSVEGSLRALEMALAQTNEAERRRLIHHSDRGVQYCCRAYVERLHSCGVRISMAEAGNPYENAMAERVNGILKQEYGLGGVFVDERQARRASKDAVYLYNEERPHLALAYRKPSQVHAEYRLAA